MNREQRKAAEQQVWSEYGAAVRAAKLAHDEAIKAALNRRNDDLAALALNMPLPSRKAS